MTKSQARQLAAEYKEREHRLAVGVAEMALALCEELLAKGDAEMRAAVQEMHDAAVKSKAAGWPGIDLERL